MKFIAYFILSGFIYYGIALYFPELFSYLLDIAGKGFAYIEAFVNEVMARVRGTGAAEQMLPFLCLFRRGR